MVIFINFKFFNKDISKVCFESKCYSVEIAQTPEELSVGLMYRENLDKDKGMLFIFEEERKQAFWMKNTLIPLDIIWINKEMNVVFIENAVPCTQEDECFQYVPSYDAIYVLEINFEEALKNNISIGSKARFR